jgi:hypothetical protein
MPGEIFSLRAALLLEARERFSRRLAGDAAVEDKEGVGAKGALRAYSSAPASKISASSGAVSPSKRPARIRGTVSPTASPRRSSIRSIPASRRKAMNGR